MLEGAVREPEPPVLLDNGPVTDARGWAAEVAW